MNSNSPSTSRDNIDTHSTLEPTNGHWFQYFGTGFMLTAIPIGVLMATFVYMTHTPLSQLGAGRLVVAIAFPWIGGAFATRYPESVLGLIEKILQNFPL